MLEWVTLKVDTSSSFQGQRVQRGEVAILGTCARWVSVLKRVCSWAQMQVSKEVWETIADVSASEVRTQKCGILGGRKCILFICLSWEHTSTCEPMQIPSDCLLAEWRTELIQEFIQGPSPSFWESQTGATALVQYRRGWVIARVPVATSKQARNGASLKNSVPTWTFLKG